VRASRRTWGWTGAVVAIALVTLLRIHTVDGLRDQGYFSKYLTFSEQAARGTIDHTRIPDLSPGYLWLLALLHGELGMERATLRDLQLVAVSVAALAAAACAEVAAGPVAALIAGVFVLGSRAAMLNATEFEPETCILLLQSLALLALFRSRPALAGALFGLSAVFRPSAIPAAIAIMLWLAWKRRGALRFGIACAVPVAAILFVNLQLTGTPVIMDPGTVFYEGMNPLAAGYSGVQPRIVNDLEQLGGEDALHVTFRLVASRATRGGASTGAANQFWAGKAWAFAREHPGAAFQLLGRKLLAASSSYDPWDLVTIVRKERELTSPLWIPFAFALVAAFAALLVRERERLAPAAIVVLFGIAAMVGTYVTARQRNAILPATAVLAGCGVAALVQRRDGRAAVAAGAIVVAGALLTLETNRAAEDRHIWEAADRAAAARVRANAAGDPNEAASWRALAYLSGDEVVQPPPRELLRASAHRLLTEGSTDPVSFDVAVALARGGQWREAELIFTTLRDRGYVPERRNRVPSSLQYHLARCALQQGKDARPLLAVARREAPGDPDVLALSGERDELALLHDPFTAGLAVARASLDTGRPEEAARLIAKLRREIPEWTRPASLVPPASIAPASTAPPSAPSSPADSRP
jgi:hypothetical protein